MIHAQKLQSCFELTEQLRRSMLSFSLEAAQDELGLLIKKGNAVLQMKKNSVQEVEIALRSESEWLREAYETLNLVFHKRTHADTLLEIGPSHPRGALSIEVGDHFAQRMKNRISLLELLRRNLGERPSRSFQPNIA